MEKKKSIRKYKTSQHNCKGIAPKIPTDLIFKFSFQRRIMKQKLSVTSVIGHSTVAWGILSDEHEITVTLGHLVRIGQNTAYSFLILMRK